MKLKKIPDKIIVNIQDAEFIFKKPRLNVFFKLINEEDTAEKLNCLLNELEEIRGVELDDGSTPTVEYMKENLFMYSDLLIEIYNKYFSIVDSFFEKKKDD